MLKLPKGLKKKKKGKKSKKDQELFTEEELEQYRREHQHQSIGGCSAVPSDSEDHSGGGEKSENDEEWSKFAALTSGIDSVLKKTQGDLNRIKSTSFFQKVPTQVEQETREREERDRREHDNASRIKEAEQTEQDSAAAAKSLINAVVELDESESNSEAEDNDIFDTGYIDAIASGELPIAYLPESPVLETLEGEDPFDTSYADKVIKGPEVSKRGKKLVSIGSAVEVLTGRVESVGSSRARGNRARRGPTNLLLDGFDDTEQQPGSSDNTVAIQDTTAAVSIEEKPFSLLDESDNFPDDIAVDLSDLLRSSLQKPCKEETNEAREEASSGSKAAHSALDLDEFDVLKTRETYVTDDFGFGQLSEEKDATKELTSTAPAHDQLHYDLSSFDESNVSDPFDTGFVEKILPATAVEDDEFDPRGEDLPAANSQLDSQLHEIAKETVTKPDSVTADSLLFDSSPDLGESSRLATFDCVNPLVQSHSEGATVSFADPFDTSNVEFVVAPGKTELKYLEEELQINQPAVGGLSHSLSDPDFDPRADCDGENSSIVQQPEETDWQEEEFKSIAQRKSSLSLQINGASLSASSATNRSKSVVFAVPTPDLLKIDAEHSVTKKPLTPYYNRENSATDVDVDPFDTSFVSSVAPTQLELHLLDQELNSLTLTHSISDPEFDPREDAPTGAAADEFPSTQRSDLLGASEQHQDHNKVLTPACLGEVAADNTDPFDTSIAVNLQPGQTELKLIENELIPPPVKTGSEVSDILSDVVHEDSSFFVKVLTPQVSNASVDLGSEFAEVDPFDTSFVPNLEPGQAEIKVLESELIDN